MTEKKPKPTLVLIDDVLMMSKAIKRMLKNHYNVVHIFTDPREAVRAIQQMNPKPDIVMTDMVMPGIFGTDVADEMMKLGIPTVMHTGNVPEEYMPKVAEQLATGALKDRLDKPVDAQTLIDALSRALKNDEY